MEVSILNYRKKEYYTRNDEDNPKYIYAIESDGELGEKVGEYNGNKKVFYRFSKK